MAQQTAPHNDVNSPCCTGSCVLGNWGKPEFRNRSPGRRKLVLLGWGTQDKSKPKHNEHHKRGSALI